MADNTGERFDFSVLDKAGEQAQAALEKGPVAPTTVEPAAPAQSVQQAPAVPQEKPQEATPGQLPDETPITLTIDGQQVTKPLGEWKSGWMMHAAFTQKTQAVSDRERQLQGYLEALQQREGQINAFLQDPRNLLSQIPPQFLMQFLQEKLGIVPQQQAQLGPEEIPTWQHVQQLVSDIRGQAQQEISQVKQEIADELFEAEVVRTTRTTIDALLGEHPELSDIPKVDVLIRRIALDDKPADTEALQKALVKAGKQLADKFKSKVQARAVESAVQQATLQHAIEPPGGTALPPQPKQYFNKSTGKVNWDELDRDAAAFMESRTKK